MPEQRPHNPILPVAVTLAVLLGLYVGAYFATVQPRIVCLAPVMVEPEYVARNEVWRRVLAPAHWLDRRLRPQVWEPEDE